MANKTSSSTTVLLVLMLIITFPIWLALGGVIIGLIGGLFGVVFGLIGAVLGVAFGLIALPFKILFGFGDWSCHWPSFSFHHNGFVWLALLIFAALVISRRAK